MSHRRPLVVANWKMNNGIAETIKFVSEFNRTTFAEDVEVVICPPFTSLYTLSVLLSDKQSILMGAQNCHSDERGAFTGEISVDFLKEVFCHYVIVGHSERRQYFHEDNVFLSKKIVTSIENDLIPIYCVGESEIERDQMKTFEVIQKQLAEGLKPVAKDDITKVVIAYEPIWAIGTGKTATPGQAEEVHGFIRKWVSQNIGSSYANDVRIIYGGSVKPDNMGSLIEMENIDGALVGGASLHPGDFHKIIECCS